MPHIRSGAALEAARPLLAVYRHLRDENDGIALVRSARLFQNALWISEDDPASSFVSLVSAVETAAGQWSAGLGSDREQLERYMPEMIRSLSKQSASEEIIQAVARRLSRLVGATAKFVGFLLEFDPGAPEKRVSGEDSARVDWTNLEAHLRMIYAWRSKALHGGIPVPAPLCEAPRPGREDGTWTERPMGLATRLFDTIWTAEETPMLIWVFSHLVRGALVKWWQSLPQERESSSVSTIG